MTEEAWIPCGELMPPDFERVDIWIHVPAPPMSMGMGDAWREINVWRQSGKWWHIYAGHKAEIRSEIVTHWRRFSGGPA